MRAKANTQGLKGHQGAEQMGIFIYLFSIHTKS